MLDEQTLYIEIGLKITALRRQQGIGQQELARAIGLTRTSITNLEAGRQHVTLFCLCQIADLLGVSLDAILPGWVFGREFRQLHDRPNYIPLPFDEE